MKFKTPVYKHDSRPTKKYLLGWVVGCDWHDGFEMLDEERVFKGGAVEKNPILRYEESSRRIALDFAAKYPNRKWFYRQYWYETKNPDHARGLPEIQLPHKKIYVN
jgi:hypothetical protein